MLSDVLYRLRCLVRRRAVDGELDQELQFHFDQQVEKLLRAGLPRTEALRQARLEFGGMEQVKEECRDARGLAALETLAQDFRHALRMWRKNPGFALAAVAAIGLGIGANAAVFTLANTVLFKSLAYEGSGHIVYVIGSKPGCEFPCDTARSYPDYREFRDQAKTFQALVAYAFSQVNLADGIGLPERYKAMRVSANAFSALGQKPLAGRDFIPADERPGAPPVALLSYGLWETRYGKDASMVGRSIRIDGLPTVVAGELQPNALTFLTVAVVLLAAGVLACAIPARRATKVDAVVALRFE